MPTRDEYLAALDVDEAHARERLRIDSAKLDQASGALQRAILSERVTSHEARLRDIAAERVRAEEAPE